MNDDLGTQQQLGIEKDLSSSKITLDHIQGLNPHAVRLLMNQNKHLINVINVAADAMHSAGGVIDIEGHSSLNDISFPNLTGHEQRVTLSPQLKISFGKIVEQVAKNKSPINETNVQVLEEVMLAIGFREPHDRRELVTHTFNDRADRLLKPMNQDIFSTLFLCDLCTIADTGMNTRFLDKLREKIVE
jgi:hypothetical protein